MRLAQCVSYYCKMNLHERGSECPRRPEAAISPAWTPISAFCCESRSTGSYIPCRLSPSLTFIRAVVSSASNSFLVRFQVLEIYVGDSSAGREDRGNGRSFSYPAYYGKKLVFKGVPRSRWRRRAALRLTDASYVSSSVGVPRSVRLSQAAAPGIFEMDAQHLAAGLDTLLRANWPRQSRLRGIRLQSIAQVLDR